MFRFILFTYIIMATAEEPDSYEEAAALFLKNHLKSIENFTTCDEFLENTHFDIKVLNGSWQEWQAFYYWMDIKEFDDIDKTDAYFQKPDAKMLQNLEKKLSGHSSNFNWTSVVMLMTINDFIHIIAPTNQPGLFNTMVTEKFLHGSLMRPVEFQMAFKFVKPHYLGIMECENRLLTGFAPVGTQLSDQEMEAAAKQFNFRSTYGISVSDLRKRIEYKKKETRTRLKAKIVDDRDLNQIYKNYHENNRDMF